MWLGCRAQEMLSGPIFSSIWSILLTCCLTAVKRGTFHPPGQAGGGSGIFSTLRSFRSQWQDKTFACRLPVHSLLPLGPPGLQQFSEQIPSGMQLSQLSSTGAGDLARRLLRGRLFPFEGGGDPSCRPLRAPRGFIPFSHRFVPPPTVPTRGRARWGSQFLNTSPRCRQHAQLRGISLAQEPPLPPHIQL